MRIHGVAIAMIFCAAPRLSSGPIEHQTSGTPHIESAGDWNAKFALTDGWIGGDGAYSTQLPDGRVLWIFCDTFIGRIENGKRVGATMVNNTAALAPSADQSAKLKFIVRRDGNGRPTSWLKPPEIKNWYWPMAATAEGKRLCLFCQRVERAGQGSGAFGFRLLGTDLAVLDMADADPLRWSVQTRRIEASGVRDGRLTTLGVAVLRHEKHVHIYGVRESLNDKLATKQLIVARTTPAELEQFPRWQFRTGSGWSTDPKKAEPVCAGVTNELSISFDPPRQRFIAIHSEGFLGPHIMLRTAPQPWGPWSEPTKIYRCPESGWDKRIFCYAAKGHPEISGTDELLITYLANSLEFKQVIDDARLYLPRFVRLRLQ